MTASHLLVPEHGGLLVESASLDLVSRLSSGSFQVVFLDPPWATEHVDPAYRELLEALLRHAKRVLRQTGNLFVRFPQDHETVLMGAALGQVFGKSRIHVITREIRRPNMARRGAPRSERETLFFARMSDESTYHPRTRPAELIGAARGDEGRAFRWESLVLPRSRGQADAYPFQGDVPPAGQAWRFPARRMHELLAQGRIERSATGTWRMKRYADEVPPVEESLEWTDVPTSLPPDERATAAEAPTTGYQLPVALLQRIIQTGSDEGDPVLVLAPDEYGTGAVACHRARRRWVSNFADVRTTGIVDQRLASEGAAYVRLGAMDLRDLPVASVSGPALLLTADQMRETSVREEALRGMVGRTFHSDVERQLAQRLLDAGVIAVHGFRVPGASMEVDFFLPGPPFGVIEIKHFRKGVVEASVEKAVDHLKCCRAALSPEARLYLVLFGADETEVFRFRGAPRGITLIAVPEGRVEEAARRIAEDFAPMARPSAFALELAADEDEITKSLSLLSIKLDAHFLSEGKQVLEHEISHLRAEIGHGHFTAAALRVGRSLEFIVYAACTSWDVKVREPILAGLTRLEDAQNQLAKCLIAYADMDRDNNAKARGRDAALDAAKRLLSVVIDVVADVDGNTVAGTNTVRPTRAVQALLNDISRAHRRHPAARNLAKTLDKPVDALLKLRNAAAHASTEGVPREVSREDLRAMIEQLSTIVLELSRCGEAILAHRQGVSA